MLRAEPHISPEDEGCGRDHCDSGPRVADMNLCPRGTFGDLPDRDFWRELPEKGLLKICPRRDFLEMQPVHSSLEKNLFFPNGARG